ncbi:MAG TPA: DUF4271 domain-containing protein [Prolixibacteraceae bacterium]|nr:DUF4271 domain-containing protein [Prolixibacteraceae bacterium]
MLTQDSTTYTDTIVLLVNEVDSIVPLPTDSLTLEPYNPETTDHRPFIADWMVITFIVTLSLFAWVKTTSGVYLNSLIQSIFNEHTANRLYREKNSNITHPSFRLDALLFITLGFFIVHFVQYYPTPHQLNELLLFFLAILLSFFYIRGKLLLYTFTGFLFNAQNETNEFIFYNMNSYRVMGIFLLPLTIILYFLEGNWHVAGVILGVLIILFFTANGLFSGIKIIAKKDFSIYYLILYLCTLEILPIFIVWKVLS